tara:strand:+ start:250 stop:1047 length:798 start_codon:yes stop_codon:yes gene_type:complete
MILEDEFGDILFKSIQGEKLTIETVSAQSQIPIDRLSQFRIYSAEPTIEEITRLATILNLNVKALIDITKHSYEPCMFDYGTEIDGIRVVRVSGMAGGYPVYAYLIIKDNECIIVDTTGDAHNVIKAVKKEHVTPLAVLITHSHGDHISGIDKLKKKYDILCYGLDNSILKQVEDKTILEFNSISIKVLYTPGHSKDSVTYIINNFFFVGDLIFAGSLGGGMYSYELLVESAKTILSMQEHGDIFPGHGPKTSIKEELEHNAFIV